MKVSAEKILDIIKILLESSDDRMTPSAIAKKVNSDQRTIIEILNVLDDKIREIRLTEEYEKLMERSKSDKKSEFEIKNIFYSRWRIMILSKDDHVFDKEKIDDFIKRLDAITIDDYIIFASHIVGRGHLPLSISEMHILYQSIKKLGKNCYLYSK